MNSRRRPKMNRLNAASLARWLVISLFAAATGLSYVYLSVQLHALGTQRSKLEAESAELRTQTKNAQAQIAALTSHTALQRRLREGFLKMIPIPDAAVVQLNPPRRIDDDAVRPVANEGDER